MSLYSDIRLKNKEKNSNNSKSIIKNQKILNIIFLITFSLILLVDIIYVSKESYIGINGFTKGFLITSIILEAISLIILILLKFNNESKIFKIGAIVIFSLPIIAYLPMLSVSGIAVFLFIFRIIFLIALIIELLIGIKYVDKKAYLFKFVSFSTIAAVLFISTFIFLVSSSNRRIKYEYDKSLGGYILKDIYDGDAPIKIKDDVVKIDDNSLENYDGKDLILPASVKEVSENAFNNTKIENVYINSKEISIYEALSNSNVKNVYINQDNTKILDLDNAIMDDELRFTVPKEYVNNYRRNNEYYYLFIPKCDEGEYYVALNNTENDILYFRENEKLEEPNNIINPYNEKYILNGWKYTFKNEKVESFPITINKSLELSAVWSYMIIYHENGGILPDDVREKEIIEGEAYEPVTPTKLGFNFVGWYDNENLEGSPITSVSEIGTELYAKWELKAPNINLSAESIDKVYNGANSTVEASIDHELKNNPDFHITYTWYIMQGEYGKTTGYIDSPLEVINASNNTYYCEVIINYLGEEIKTKSNNVLVNIAKADYDLSNLNLVNSQYEYNGKPQYPNIDNKINTIGDGALSVEIVKDDSKITKANSASTVKYVFNTTSINYNKPEDIEITVTILKKSISVIWDDLEFIYNTTKQLPDGDLDGVIGSEDVSLSVTDIQAINAGKYQTHIGLVGDDSLNYKLDKQTVEFIINKANFEYIPDTSSVVKTHTYDGTYFIPTLTDLPEGVSVSNETIGVKDYTLSGSVLYKFSYDNQNYEAPADYRLTGIIINKKDISIEIINNNLTYNGEEQKPEFKIDNEIENDDIIISSSRSYVDAKEYIISEVSISGESKNNYNVIIPENFRFIIKRADVVVVWDNLEYTYDGMAHKPTAKAIVSNDVEFNLDVNNEFINSGNYTVEAVANTNYNIISGGITEFTILKKNINISWDKTEFTYNGVLQTPKAITNDLIGSDTVSFKYDNQESINAKNKYSITVSLDATNYKLVGDNLTCNYDILKATLDDDFKYVITDQTYTYNGLAQYPRIEGKYWTSYSSVEIKYEYLNDYINVGSYDIEIRFYTEDNNYNDLIKTGNVVITKRELTLDLDKTEFVYNEEKQNPEILSINNAIATDNVNIRILNNTVDASDDLYILDLLIDDNNINNYEILKTYSYKINKKPIEIDSTNYNIINYNGEYDGLDHTVSVEILNSFAAKAIIETYYKDVNTNQVVEIRFESTNNNYIITNSATGYVTIRRKTLSINVDDSNLIYNGLAQAPAVTLDGIINDEDVSVLINNNDINAGTYILNLELIGNNKSNYQLDNNNNYYEIKKLGVAISWSDELSFVFNNTELKPSAYYIDVLNNQIDVNVESNTLSKNVGDYIAYANVLDSNYYIIANNEVEFEITKAELLDSDISVVFNNLEFEYDGNLHQPTIKSYKSIAPDGSEINYEVINSFKKAGRFAAYVKFVAESNNYEDKFIKTTVIINKKQIDVRFENLTYENTGTNIVPIITGYTGLIDGDDFYVTISNLADFNGIGSYEIELELNGDDKNNYYIDNTYTLIITVHIYTLENITITDYVGTYDGEAHYPSVDLGEDSSWVSVSYGRSIKNVCNEEVVIITFTSLDDEREINNSTAEGRVTINPKELTVIVDNEIDYNGNYQTPGYTLSGDIEDPNITFNNRYKDAGTYTADINIGNNNYVLSDESELTFKIVGVKVTIKWNQLEFVYNGTEIKPTAYVVSKDSEELIDTVVNVTTNGKCIDVRNNYTAIASLSDANYEIDNVSDITKTFVITECEVELVWFNLLFEYDGLDNKIPSASYKLINGEMENANVEVINGNYIPGTYQAKATLNNSNYKILGSNQKQFEIVKGDISNNLPIYNSITSFTYDGNSHSPYVLADTFASDETPITFNCDSYINSGTYNVEIIFSAGEYYNNESVYVTLIIEKRELEITLINDVLEYNGQIQKPTFEVSNNILGENITVIIKNTNSRVEDNILIDFAITVNPNNNYVINNEYYYSIIKGNISLDNITINKELTYNGDIQYPVISNLPLGISIDYENSTGVKYVSDNSCVIAFAIDQAQANNYNAPENITISGIVVSPKIVTISWSDKVFNYDGNYHIPQASIIGLENDDNSGVRYLNDDYKNNINRGTYTIVIVGLTNDNYELETASSCEYEITYGVYDTTNIVFNDITATYDGKVHKGVLVSGDLPSGISIEYDYKGVDPINVGNYPVTATLKDAENGNYEDVSLTAYVIINPANLTISWSNLTFTYDKTSHKPEASILNGKIGSDIIPLAVTGDKINAGKYIATVSTTNTNYQIQDNTIEFEIKPIEVEITSISHGTKTGQNVYFDYDGRIHNDISVEYSDENILSGEGIGQVIIDTSKIKADATFIDYNETGAYPYYISFSNTNYVPSITSGSVSIHKIYLYGVNMSQDNQYDLPVLYATINGLYTELGGLGDGLVYYKYYDSNRNELDETPKTSGTYYIMVVSDYAGVFVVTSSYMQKQFTYVGPEADWKYNNSLDNYYFSVTAVGDRKDLRAYGISGVSYGQKLNSKGSITIELTKKTEVTFYIYNDKTTTAKINIGSNEIIEAIPGQSEVTVTLDAGTYVITKNGSVESAIYEIYLKVAE